MKATLRFFVIFTLVQTNLFAQNFWVPDSNFRAKIKLICPTCLTAQDSLITNSINVQYMQSMDVSNSSISSLIGITYFRSLFSLNCSNNQLTSLPALSDSLVILNCDSNQLTSLPVLPPKLDLLYCSNNQLINLPPLPTVLGVLDCSFNYLTSLPISSIFIFSLDCRHNQLTSLPKISNYISYLAIDNNPIICFPELSPPLPGSLGLISLTMDSTLINCIPNTGIFPLSAIQSPLGLPFCSPSNNSCFNTFTAGYVFLDLNGNGLKDTMEIGLSANLSYTGTNTIYTDSLGFFNALSDTGNITFQMLLPAYYTFTTPGSQMVHVVSGIVDTIYFGLQASLNVNDLKVDLTSIGLLRPGFKANYRLQYQNVGTDTITNVVLKFLKPASLSNLSSLPSANAVSGDTLFWNFPYLSPFQQGSILIMDSVFSTSTLGDTAIAYAWIEPLLGDSTPQNNVSKSVNIIRGSYDPNDKSVYQQVVLPNSNEYLEYRIRFQNTGTDIAFAVMITDTISTLLDASSIQMINASHNYDLWVENGVVKWNFINILLPDSNTNELASHGFVKFRIKPLPGLTVADSIPNSADIYFDYNAAVITNTIVVNVLNPLKVKDLQEMELQVYPNPVQESMRIVNQHPGPLGKIELINASGKVLETKTISSSNYIWSLQHLPAGTYILKGQGWGQKVVKE